MLVGLLQHASGRQKLDQNTLAGAIMMMSAHFSVLGATAFVLWWNRVSWREAFGFGRRSAASSMILGAGMTVIFLPVGWVLQSVSLDIIQALQPNAPVQVQEAVEMLRQAHSPDSRAAQVFFAVMLAPLAEEMLFRGILYPAIKQFKLPRLALFVSAFLFAAAHGNWPIFVPLLVLGLALALLYEKTGDLLAPVTAHAIFNGINVIMLFRQSQLPVHP